MPQKYDAIVIGGGHNGLVNAAYLARAGKKVLLLEQRPLVGGASVTEEVFPGFKFSVFSYVVSLFRPEIIRDLELPRHGLTILPLESTLTPLPDGNYLYRDGDHFRTLRDIARFSPRDAEAYDEYGRTMFFMAKAVKYILGIVPPDPTTFRPGDVSGLLKLARHMLGLGEENLYTLARLMTMSSADFLAQWFESEPLMATLSSSGIIGTYLGPRSPGTAYVLLHHYMGEIDGQFRAWGFQKGGTGGVANAIASAARELGAEIRTNARVAQIVVKNGRAGGVVLENGDELEAKVVVSSLDPKQTFLKLVGEEHLPSELVAAVRHFNIRGSSAKVNLALDAAPELACRPGAGRHLAGAVSISPNIDYLERAYDDAKYGRFSRRPYIDIIIPSMIDPDMAPPGKHVMSCFVQYAPYQLRDGTWDEQREALGDTVVDTLAEYFPNIKNIILHRQVMTPLDIERTVGLSQGNIFQGELTLSQLFFLRPAAGVAQYRTPIKGYYQCGSATHPGGGITGAPGRLAALEILKDGV
ncbi:MAG: NAD(P)/FAD-dependent oxidoreductase [Chloroflexi bacterium]|nr:NAD(P)/FAD-dependent oxidoreductase [Chloroflexota bacterium]MCI0580630.1 NAD(P)/FAD-dependent oxidoreductase [Chloroflexota bacterium]MCI0647642.1 NAD(P)/FAD-dependent oxidoreductase [Chloroflexota bacterium]MCI0731142.1 NAD(P)/FAD-dependent oxidoreductase [Chloroflexota bacterium]